MTINLDSDAATYVATALTEVCFGTEESHPLEATIDRYFTADYSQRTDGELVDRRGFAEHIRALRGVVADGRIEVLEILRDGDRIADHHRVTVVKRDGSVSQLEIYLFGQLADDGRLRRVDEVSRAIGGSEDDAGLARTR